MTLIKNTTRAQPKQNFTAALRTEAFMISGINRNFGMDFGISIWGWLVASGGFYDCHRQLQLTLLDPGPANNRYTEKKK